MVGHFCRLDDSNSLPHGWTICFLEIYALTYGPGLCAPGPYTPRPFTIFFLKSNMLQDHIWVYVAICSWSSRPMLFKYRPGAFFYVTLFSKFINSNTIKFYKSYLQNTQHMVLRNRPTLSIGTGQLACLNSPPGVQLGNLAGRSRFRAPAPSGALLAVFFSTLPSFLLRHLPYQPRKSVRVIGREPYHSNLKKRTMFILSSE